MLYVVRRYTYIHPHFSLWCTAETFKGAVVDFEQAMQRAPCISNRWILSFDWAPAGLVRMCSGLSYLIIYFSW
jgi:hypothetical protein